MHESSGGMIEQWWYEGAVSRGSLYVFAVMACVSSGSMSEEWCYA